MSRTVCQQDRVRPKVRTTSETDDVYAECMQGLNAMRQEHDRLAKGLMLTVDLLGDVQHGERVHLENLRRATAKMLRESLLARERGVFKVLGYEDMTDGKLEQFLDEAASSGEES